MKFQRVLKIIKHTDAASRVASKADYEIQTDEGDTYFTRRPAAGECANHYLFGGTLSRRYRKKRICTHPPFHHDAPF
nr:hypothetical protein GCM10020185_63960 [Pseudomonas brassicacearum subsp. brassicacearum]